MKLISFSLWGENPLYLEGMAHNLDLAKVLYPDWVVRVYHDETVPERAVEILRAGGAEMVLVKKTRGSWDGLFWRFYPADDPTVEAFIVRDADSRLTSREKAAVEEWIGSPMGLHTMRDHWNHNVPILGGMWGMKRGCVGGIVEKLRESNFDEKGTDQTFLDKLLWPIARPFALAHDRYPEGFYKLPDKTFRFPHEVAVHNRHDFCGGTEREFPRGKIVLKDGTVFQRLDVYAYDPPHLFGPHEIRPFTEPKLEYGRYVGEASQDFDRPYDSTLQDYIR